MTDLFTKVPTARRGTVIRSDVFNNFVNNTHVAFQKLGDELDAGAPIGALGVSTAFHVGPGNHENCAAQVKDLNNLRTELSLTESELQAIKTGAETAESNANSHANAASTSATNSQNSANASSSSASSAAASVVAAQGVVDTATTDFNTLISNTTVTFNGLISEAYDWANKPFNIEVTPGEYSAKHWATVAQNVANGLDFASITTSSGAASATVSADSLSIVGATGISTSATGKTVTITGPNLTDYVKSNIAEAISSQWFFNSGLYIGTVNDLEIWTDSSNAYINNKAGHLNFRYWNGSTWLQSIQVASDGSVKLYDEGSQKLQTHSTGITVSGAAIVVGDIYLHDNNKLKIGDAADLRLWHDGVSSFIDNTGSNLRITNGGVNQIVSFSSGEVKLYCAGAEKLVTNGSGVDITGTLKVNGAEIQDKNDRELILTQDVPGGAGVAYLDFTSFANSKFSGYEIKVNNLRNVTNGIAFYLQFKEIGESFADYNRYQYTGTRTVNNFSGPTRIDSNVTGSLFTRFELSSANALIAGSTGCLSGTVEISSINTNNVQISSKFTGRYNSANSPVQVTVIGGDYLRNINDVDGIRLFFNSDTMNAGSVSLYGVTK